MASTLKVDTIQTNDGTGTIALQNQLSGMTTASLPALGSAQMPAGSVLQVVENTSTTQQAHSSAAWVDTALSLTITPRSTSSKVYLQYSFRGIHMPQNAGFAFRFVRGSTPLFTPSDGLEHYYYSTAAFNSDYNIAIDSPNTTSATTYKIQMRCYSTGTITINSGSAYKNSLIAMEIAG